MTDSDEGGPENIYVVVSRCECVISLGEHAQDCGRRVTWGSGTRVLYRVLGYIDIVLVHTLPTWRDMGWDGMNGGGGVGGDVCIANGRMGRGTFRRAHGVTHPAKGTKRKYPPMALGCWTLHRNREKWVLAHRGKWVLWGCRSRQKDSGSHRAWEGMGTVYSTESTQGNKRDKGWELMMDVHQLLSCYYVHRKMPQETRRYTIARRWNVATDGSVGA